MCTLTALLLTKKNTGAYLSIGGSRYCSVILITLNLVAKKELELGTRFSYVQDCTLSQKFASKILSQFKQKMFKGNCVQKCMRSNTNTHIY